MTSRRRPHVRDAPLSRPGGRLLIPVSRVSRDALAHQLEGRSHRRRVRHDEHAEAARVGGRARARGGDLRRQGQDLPRRSVRGVQGEPRADAHGAARPARTHSRHRARPRLSGAGGGRRGGRRRHRHPRGAGQERRTRRARIHRRQGHGSARRRPRHHGQHHGRGGPRCVRGGSQVRRAAGVHRRLPHAGGRYGRQRPRRAESGAEDRGQVARLNIGRSRTSSSTPGRSRARSARTCVRASSRFRSRRSW